MESMLGGGVKASEIRSRSVRVSEASEDYQLQAISHHFIKGKAGKALVFHLKQATELPGVIEGVA